MADDALCDLVGERDAELIHEPSQPCWGGARSLIVGCTSRETNMHSFETLLALPNLAGLSDDDALAAVASLIDLSSEHRSDAGIARALSLAEELRTRILDSERHALLWYFSGNAWSVRRHLESTGEAGTWRWDRPAAYQEVLSFRRALSHEGFSRLDRLRRCQVLTNLGNVMSNLGRFVEALDYYDRALGEDANFGMALGNRGQCLLSYARGLYDGGHRVVFASESVRILEQALRFQLEPGVADEMGQLLAIARQASAGSRFAEDREALRAFSLGESEDEVAFRSWALRERLFLNPLNDLGEYEVAACDVLHLPEVRVVAAHGTGFHGFMNQLKQEYAAARILLFESRSSAQHYADRDLRLLDTLDGTAFGLRLEKTKLAFRSAYSVLDKLAVFVALYFALPVQLHRTSFRNVWFTNGRGARELRSEFADRKNWPLRGLFWLAKDLAEEDADFHEAMEPDAQETATLRNRLEHQYVKIVNGSANVASAPPPDPFAYRVEIDRLQARALRMVRTARAALIYLSLAVHAEERQKPPSEAAGTAHGTLPIID